MGQRGAISLTGWQALISCFLCSPALPPAVPMTFFYRHTLPSSRARQRVPSRDGPSDGVLLPESCLHESPGLRCPQRHSRCLPLCPICTVGSWLPIMSATPTPAWKEPPSLRLQLCPRAYSETRIWSPPENEQITPNRIPSAFRILGLPSGLPPPLPPGGLGCPSPLSQAA